MQCTWEASMLIAAALGFGAAFLGSIPIAGPLALVVVGRFLDRQYRNGLFVAFGGAVAEAAYALVIGLAFPLLHRWDATVLPIARGAGAAILVIIGAVMVMRPEALGGREGTSQRGSFFTGLAVAGLNPTMLATWSVVVGALYAEGLLEVRLLSALPFAFGVLVGVLGWFAVLALVGARFGRHVTGAHRSALLRGFGVVLVAAGCYLGARTVMEL
jgi:threonine/homoserine/homoserine lactone efflux protein